MLSQNRSTPARGAGNGNPPGEYLRAGAAVETGVVTVNPFQGVFPQQDGIHVTHQDRHVRVANFLGKAILVVKIYINKLGIGKHVPELAHTFFVVPDGGDNLFDFGHFFSSCIMGSGNETALR